MIIINTTFILDPAIAPQALAWVKDSYAARVRDDRRLLTRIITDEGEGGYALHLTFDDMESAQGWDSAYGAPLRGELTDRWGERALSFCTFLETVE